MWKAAFFAAFFPLVDHHKAVDEHDRQNIGHERRASNHGVLDFAGDT
jgi:hypothetical protein